MVSINDQPVQDVSGLLATVASLTPGSTYTVVVERREGTATLKVVPAKRPVGGVGEQRRVGPARERHHDALQLAQVTLERGVRRRHRLGQHDQSGTPAASRTSATVPTAPVTNGPNSA